MPPPSSDKRKWWLDHNASSKVEIPKPPGEGWILNPNRPKNPFDLTDEPDWIKVNAVQIPVSSTPEKKVPPPPPPRRQKSEGSPTSPRDPEIRRRQSSIALDGKTKPPVPPKPTFISARPIVSSPRPADDGGLKPEPRLLPQRPHVQDVGQEWVEHVEKNGKVGLLMDEEEGERIVGGWIPLQPSKEL